MCDYIELAIHLVRSYRSERVSRSRLVKSIYLCDWKACLADGSPMTKATWTIDECGPYSSEIAESIVQTPDVFGVEEKTVGYDTVKYISLKTDREVSSLSKRDLEIVDFVINRMNVDSYSHLNAVVNSTFPAYFCREGEVINMVELSKMYINQLAKPDREKVRLSANSAV